jgi:hypothetical protein
MEATVATQFETFCRARVRRDRRSHRATGGGPIGGGEVGDSLRVRRLKGGKGSGARCTTAPPPAHNVDRHRHDERQQ